MISLSNCIRKCWNGPNYAIIVFTIEEEFSFHFTILFLENIIEVNQASFYFVFWAWYRDEDKHTLNIKLIKEKYGDK